MSKTPPPFHLALPVDDLARAEEFYARVLGCEIGRRSANWIDFNFFGHQLVTHLAPGECGYRITNQVDGKDVPVKHFGVVLDRDTWQAVAQRLKNAGTEFIIEPGIRFEGQAGEQGTFFLLDPAGNALEFKWLKEPEMLFES